MKDQKFKLLVRFLHKSLMYDDKLDKEMNFILTQNETKITIESKGKFSCPNIYCFFLTEEFNQEIHSDSSIF